ncbi:hypothetical protein N4G70_36185 [Streptomyces sp. ASQP_92]|uniref:hypothetical protein n=1 Tax=Streptomyces sp. ASQP_92 TaxID=2979116 RepID=UPI0021C06761|nr:hypothetical protein [Streptomyces sp. ASQP_92]MCT9094242.1 hypothetical protein [Streptomyces sp. ASQP_92]
MALAPGRRPRDPRTLTAAERAAASTWVEAPASVQPVVRTGRRRLGTGPVDPGG